MAGRDRESRKRGGATRRTASRALRCGRRGESLIEVFAALVIFALAMTGLGKQWVYVTHHAERVKEKQALARVIEQRLEQLRARGALYLPQRPYRLADGSQGPPLETMTGESPAYYDALGRPVPSSVPGGYFTRSWVTYLTDGSPDGVGINSLREIRVEVYRTGDGKRRDVATTYVAGANVPDALR